MDLSARKYRFIQELTTVDDEGIMETLERVLKREKEAHQEISGDHRKELDNRLESYSNNPEELLDWEKVKKDW